MSAARPCACSGSAWLRPDGVAAIPTKHLFGQLGLGAHPDLLWHSGPLAALLVMSPLLGQIQLPVDESLTPKGGIGQKHPDLAVLRLAGGAGVLALDPGAALALLDEARLIDDEDRTLLAQMLSHIASQIVAHEIGVPVGSSQQMLYAIGCSVSRHFSQLPRVLALGCRKQTAQIVPRPASNLAAREERGDSFVECIHLLGPRAHRLSIHCLWHHILLRQREHDARDYTTIYNCSTRACYEPTPRMAVACWRKRQAKATKCSP